MFSFEEALPPGVDLGQTQPPLSSRSGCGQLSWTSSVVMLHHERAVEAHFLARRRLLPMDLVTWEEGVNRRVVINRLSHLGIWHGRRRCVEFSPCRVSYSPAEVANA